MRLPTAYAGYKVSLLQNHLREINLFQFRPVLEREHAATLARALLAKGPKVGCSPSASAPLAMGGAADQSASWMPTNKALKMPLASLDRPRWEPSLRARVDLLAVVPASFMLFSDLDGIPHQQRQLRSTGR